MEIIKSILMVIGIISITVIAMYLYNRMTDKDLINPHDHVHDYDLLINEVVRDKAGNAKKHCFTVRCLCNNKTTAYWFYGELSIEEFKQFLRTKDRLKDVHSLPSFLVRNKSD